MPLRDARMTSVPSTCPWPRGADRSSPWNLRSRSRAGASDEGHPRRGAVGGRGRRGGGNGGAGVGRLDAGDWRAAPSASAAATAAIPPAMLALYQQSAETCPGLPWTILAAIGTIESDNGQSNLPGVRSGANAAGAMGLMQFEPATFAKGSTRDWFADLRFQIAWRSPGVLTSCSAVLSRSAAPAHRGRVQMDDSPQVLGRAADQTSC
jgi:hypothetical protein